MDLVTGRPELSVRSDPADLSIVESDLSIVPAQRLDGSASAVDEIIAGMSELLRPISPRVLLAVPGDDVHVAANWLCERLLTVAGADVTNLGVMAQWEDIRSQLATQRFDALVISSINGHAEQNCGDWPSRAADLGFATPMYLGGNLSVQPLSADELRCKYGGLGFAETYPYTPLIVGLHDVADKIASASRRELSRGGTVQAPRRETPDDCAADG